MSSCILHFSLAVRKHVRLLCVQYLVQSVWLNIVVFFARCVLFDVAIEANMGKMHWTVLFSFYTMLKFALMFVIDFSLLLMIQLDTIVAIDWIHFKIREEDFSLVQSVVYFLTIRLRKVKSRAVEHMEFNMCTEVCFHVPCCNVYGIKRKYILFVGICWGALVMTYVLVCI